MTKQELIDRITEKTNENKWDVRRTLEAFFTEVKSSLAEGESIVVMGFGSFEVVHRKQKKARDIKANSSIVIPERTIPIFRPSKEFIDLVWNKEPTR